MAATGADARGGGPRASRFNHPSRRGAPPYLFQCSLQPGGDPVRANVDAPLATSHTTARSRSRGNSHQPPLRPVLRRSGPVTADRLVEAPLVERPSAVTATGVPPRAA